jgi:hypothetical protein
MSDEYGKYCHSQDEEIWNSDHFDTKNEAALDADACYAPVSGETFLIGKVADPLNGISFDVSDLITERLAEWMYEKVGDCSDDWLTGDERKRVEERIKKEIEPLLEKIIREEAKPTFYSIDDVEVVDMEKETEAQK